MKEATITTIEAILLADPTVEPDLVQRVKAACAEQAPRPGPKVTARKAAEVLDVHVRTLGRYAKEGKLHPIRLSRRKLRYSLPEIEKFAAEGMP
jgi:hypothetical protein